jgi:hypothetical protein
VHFLHKNKVEIDLSQNSLPHPRIKHQRTTTKIVAHSTDHANAHFGPTQQPTLIREAILGSKLFIGGYIFVSSPH